LENFQRYIFLCDSTEERKIWISNFKRIFEFLSTDDSISTNPLEDDDDEDYETLSIDDQTLVLFDDDGKSIEATKGSDRSKIRSIFSKAKKKIEEKKKVEEKKTVSPKLSSPRIQFPSPVPSIDKKLKETDMSHEIQKRRFAISEEISVSDLKPTEDSKDFTFTLKVRK
jgi:catalase (peroxidase I)